MHRDVKIGLVLGVVLVAVIAALFFRREPVDDGLVLAGDLSGPSRSAIDERVARAPSAPYLMPLEPLAESRPEAPPAPSDFEEGRLTSPAIPSPADKTRSVAVNPIQQPGPIQDPVNDRPQWRPVPALQPDDYLARTSQPDRETSPAKSHRLERGDTLYGLAERYLGDGDQYRLLFDVNRAILAEPDRLPVGVEIVIPGQDGWRKAGSQVEEHAAANAAEEQSTPFQPEVDSRPRRYTVARGDTLIKIAQRVYGDGRQYRRIYQANRSRLRNPDRLIEDMVLEIP